MKETIKFILFILAVVVMWFLAFGNVSIYQIEEPKEWPPKTETTTPTTTP